MGEGIVAVIVFVIVAVGLLVWAYTSRRARQRTALDDWPSASPGERPPGAGRAPAEPGGTEHGHGGIGASHHGDQRTFGGYGSDTESRPRDDRSRGAA